MMINRFYAALLILLVMAGVFLVYQEAQARPVMCVYAEYWCTAQCQGSFSIDYCYEEGAHLYCWFICTFSSNQCGWTPPYVYAQCEGGINK